MKTMQISNEITLTKLQRQAVDAVLDWYATDEKAFVVGGYAGTGKSTIAKIIKDKIGNCLFAAYTGKAAHILREKGLRAETIHSLLYNYEGKDAQGNPIFSLKDNEVKFLLIVDEYSMIPPDMIDEIKFKCPKVLFLGDPAQLPPIGYNEQYLKPDIFLTEIHRQALDNPIIKWAHHIREGGSFNKFFSDDCFEVARRKDVREKDIDLYEQILVGKNLTRDAINKRMRQFYGKTSPFPMRGDKMICRKNNHKEELFNGLLFSCQQNSIDCGPESYEIYVNGRPYKAWKGDILGANKKLYDYRTRLERFEYAYAITCHLSQGSEFESVLVFDEGWGATKNNWLYTAITRAKERCTVLL